MKLFNHKLRAFMVVGIALLAPLPFSSIVLALDGASTIENVPPEVLAISLKQLLEKGDYQSFLKAELVNKSNFQAAINGDPVLKGTLQGLRDPELHKLIDEIKTLEGYPSAKMKQFFARINSIAQQVSDDPSVRAQISRNLIRLIFKPLSHIVGRITSLDYDAVIMLMVVAQHLPIEDLPLLDDLVTHAISKNKSKEVREMLEGSLYLGLATNKNIPPVLIVERIKRFLPTINPVYPYVRFIYEAILEIAKRPDIDETTIRFFKENENNPRWKRDEVLGTALDAIKANPAYSK